MSDSKILILDIETTGFMPKGSLVEIAFVELDLNTGNRKLVFESVCKEPDRLTSKHREYLDYVEKGLEPPKNCLGWIFWNSTLTPEEVRDAPTLEELSSDIQSIINIYDNGITAFNRDFDIRYLQDRGFKFGRLLDCPMKLMTPIMNLPGKYGAKWPKVEECFQIHFGNQDYKEAHRAGQDAMDEAVIVQYLHDKHGYYKS